MLSFGWMFARALALRCPNCGGGGVLASWFHLKTRCPRCGLAFERNESPDYFLGGMMFNIALAESAYAAIMVLWVVLSWPAVPWDLLEYIGVPFMIAAPFIFYPISKLVFLAFDIAFRPLRPDELDPRQRPI